MRKNISLVLLFGISLGLLTSLGQTYLPDPLTQLANSYSVWLLFAFACGALVSRYRWAVIAGAVIQYIALATYYVLLYVRFEDAGFNASSNIIWFLGGTLIGPLAGLCGKVYANRAKYNSYALSFIIAITLSESIFNFIQLKYVGEGIVFLVMVIGLLISLLWSFKDRKKIVLPLALFTFMAYIGYAFVLTPLFN